MTIKRPRGRPPGSGIDDARFLARVADEVLKVSGLKPTTAMKRLLRSSTDWQGASEEAALRRWQTKWKSSSAGLMVQAGERATATPKRIVGGYSPHYGVSTATEMFARAAHAHNRLLEMTDTPGFRAAVESAMALHQKSASAARRALDSFTDSQREQIERAQRLQDALSLPEVRRALDPFTALQREQMERDQRIRDAMNPPGFRAALRQFEEVQKLIAQAYPRRPFGGAI